MAAIEGAQFWSLTANGEVFFTLAGNEGQQQQQEQVRVGLGAERTFTHGRRLRMEVTWQQHGLFNDPGQSGEYIYFRIGFIRSW